MIELLRTEPYRRLVAAVCRSLEANRLQPTGKVSIAEPTDDERRAIIGITGIQRDAGAKRLTIDMAQLDAVLHRSTGYRLAVLMPILKGTELKDRAGIRDTSVRAASRQQTLIQASALYEKHSWYQQWSLTIRPILTRLINTNEQHRLSQAIRVLETLDTLTPEDNPMLLAALAERATGDTKALAWRKTLANLVLRALSYREQAATPETAEEARELWSAANVVVDDLASRVLVLNLPAHGEALGEWLTSAAKFGTPFQVTLQQLIAHPITIDARTIYVCENPAVLRKAAQELGSACPPLICTEGQPSVALHRLLKAATTSAVPIYYHGDFDWPGISMANRIITRHNARAWQMTTEQYDAGIRDDVDHVALTGKSVEASWDKEVTRRMNTAGLAVYEEAQPVTAKLLADLTDGIRG